MVFERCRTVVEPRKFVLTPTIVERSRTIELRKIGKIVVYSKLHP